MAYQESYHPPAPFRSIHEDSFGQQGRDDTENDELRGVIDDLTVENKKLKNLLRNRQSRPNPASSSPDKVIEVRMHGLPTKKKRELEQILKTFTTGLNGETPSHPGSATLVDKSAAGTETGALMAQKFPSAPTNNTDSGYVSVSNSNMHSLSGPVGLRDSNPKVSTDKDIKSYLYDIPDSLFPQEALSVSTHAKMEMVVQRLEQLFTGNLAKPGEHSLPVQQQKISRSAAKADRLEDARQNRTTKAEGTREARVLPLDSKVNLDVIEQKRQALVSQLSNRSISSSSDTSKSPSERPASPDQRPTRPLDLDIHRAQVAVDNVKYLRHLGFSSPQIDDEGERKDQPWLYLNLLVSLAQLHTLNVTPSFIRKSIRHRSAKFELSKDGHKIRWKGNAESGVSPYNQASPASVRHRTSDNTPDDVGRRSERGSATSTLNNATSISVSDDKAMQGQASTGVSKLVNFTTASTNPTPAQPSLQSKCSTFDYKPIVYQGKKNVPKASNSYLDSSSSHDETSLDSSGLAHALSRSSLKTKAESHEGYMVFFNNPYFCTDLSGDKSPINMSPVDSRGAHNVLGLATPQLNPVDETSRDATECYFTCLGPEETVHQALDCPSLKWEPSSIQAAGEYETQPMELPASGLGGVRPEDNFALDVKVARFPAKRPPAKIGGKRKRGQQTSLVYSYRVETCDKLTLQPSRLPPPSYVFFTSSSSSGADRGGLYNESTSDTSDVEDSPVPADLLWQWSSSSNERQTGEDECSESSSSLGGLEAARARLEHPSNVGARDRDFIHDPAGRPMSGSLAATVGASWSVASMADPDADNDQDDLSSEMSVDS
jgi:hypothetical protein